MDVGLTQKKYSAKTQRRVSSIVFFRLEMRCLFNKEVDRKYDLTLRVELKT